MLGSYEDFTLEKRIETFLVELESIMESTMRQTGPYSFEWDMEPQKTSTVEKIVQSLKKMVEKLPKEKIEKIFYSLMRKVDKLPDAFKRRVIVAAATVFPLFIYIAPIMSDTEPVRTAVEETTKIKKEIIREFKRVIKKSSFNLAQDIVETAEGGYSDDRSDPGNWIKVPGGKRFIGTNYGISAPVLQDYLGKLPKADDMRTLTKEEARKIYMEDYWSPQNLSNFCDQSVANIVYDGCVNHGVGNMQDIMRTAIKTMKEKISDTENPFSQKWIREVNAFDQEKFFKAISDAREDFYRNIRTFKIHGDGWLKRLRNINYETHNA